MERHSPQLSECRDSAAERCKNQCSDKYLRAQRGATSRSLYLAFLIGPLLSTFFLRSLLYSIMPVPIRRLLSTRHGIMRSVVVHAFIRARPEAGSMLAKEESECAKHSRGFQQAGPAR